MHDEWGITDGYHDIRGEWHVTSERARDRLRSSMGTPDGGPPMWFVTSGHAHDLWNPCELVLEDGTNLGEIRTLAADVPLGYHDLVPIHGGPTTRLIVHPEACPTIPHTWGITAQIYALWSDRSWGIGDLRDLAVVAGRVQEAGGGAILVSPLHQASPAMPQEDSPYYPSTRRAWGPMLLGIDEPPPPELQCTAGELIVRDEVWAAKRSALETIFGASNELPPLPGSIAIWNALCDEFGPFWREWPLELRRYDRDVLVGRLRDDRSFAQRASFHQWCQGQIGNQIDDVRNSGIDIIGDLAIGFAPNGADAWEYQDLLALDMRVGAPPDPFNEDGQEWGIPPFIPWKVRNARYAPFIETIRACLRGCSGLRIDHVMGLFRQFWIPAGMSPAEGAYVWYPANELLAIVCLEAVRAGAFVVGEDLGTVEPHVRDALASRHIAGTRVLLFEDEPPREWSTDSLATVTTHDLPTIAGVWSGTDGDDDQRRRLSAVAVDADSTEGVIDRAHEALLGAAARLRLLSLDDVCAADERPNRPGTTDQPNWRRRLPLPVDKIEFPATEPRSPGIDN